MPVCSIVKLLPFGTVDDVMHYCTWPSAPRGNSLDYTTKRHEIAVLLIGSGLRLYDGSDVKL